MKIEIGTTPRTKGLPVKMPLFMVSIHKSSNPYNVFIMGRLYSGYVGLMVTAKRLFSLDIWIYYPQKG